MTRENGFTLLEILVALLVFGLVLVGLTRGVHYGLQAWRSQMRITADHDDLDAVDGALRRMTYVMDPGDDVDPAPITAAHDHLEFISVLPDDAGTAPARRMAAALLVDRAHRLVLRWRPYIHARPIGPPLVPTETELLQGVSRLEFSFWRPAGGWINAWQDPGLPALIRIRIVFPAGDPRHWPDIVVAPLLNPS
jgi:general secretion pathway protein J